MLKVRRESLLVKVCFGPQKHFCAEGACAGAYSRFQVLIPKTAVRLAHLIPHWQEILADAVSQWPTLDCGPCNPSPAAVCQAWAALAPVFDKPQHSHWLWFPVTGCPAVRWQMLTHTASDTGCKTAGTRTALGIYRTKSHSSLIPTT